MLGRTFLWIKEVRDENEFWDKRRREGEKERRKICRKAKYERARDVILDCA